MKPQQASLRGRVLKFFADNPTEELTFEDVMTKFGGNPRSVQEALSRMRTAGELERAKVWRKKGES